MFDKITIYAGADDTAPKLLDSCSIDHPVIVTSSSNKMFIRFHTDHSYQSAGFELRYRSVDIQCGGQFTAPTGVIHSPNYPNNYPNNQDCEWLIQVDRNHLVNLTFTDFDLERTGNCTDDYVRVSFNQSCKYLVGKNHRFKYLRHELTSRLLFPIGLRWFDAGCPDTNINLPQRNTSFSNLLE